MFCLGETGFAKPRHGNFEDYSLKGGILLLCLLFPCPLYIHVFLKWLLCFTCRLDSFELVTSLIISKFVIEIVMLELYMFIAFVDKLSCTLLAQVILVNIYVYSGLYFTYESYMFIENPLVHAWFGTWYTMEKLVGIYCLWTCTRCGTSCARGDPHLYLWYWFMMNNIAA